jgi:hypothetical protein
MMMTFLESLCNSSGIGQIIALPPDLSHLKQTGLRGIEFYPVKNEKPGRRASLIGQMSGNNYGLTGFLIFELMNGVNPYFPNKLHKLELVTYNKAA